MEKQKSIIQSYVLAYNNFDVAGMCENLHEEVVFENISAGEVNLRTDGLQAFREQAEKAKVYFAEREQQIEEWEFVGEWVKISIAYRAVLAVDFSDNMQKGDTLEMKGESEFTFKNGKLILIRDKS
ncbi:MAG: nuclear transport factor 2 family protein [Bacteroidia bacterium]|nr:nuclear transport factor 2 family protein [Bacteroidia bacterium]